MNYKFLWMKKCLYAYAEKTFLILLLKKKKENNLIQFHLFANLGFICFSCSLCKISRNEMCANKKELIRPEVRKGCVPIFAYFRSEAIALSECVDIIKPKEDLKRAKRELKNFIEMLRTEKLRNRQTCKSNTLSTKWRKLCRFIFILFSILWRLTNELFGQ